jgi:hypothetical protein
MKVIIVHNVDLSTMTQRNAGRLSIYNPATFTRERHAQ